MRNLLIISLLMSTAISCTEQTTTDPGLIDSEQAFINWASQAATPIATLDPAEDNSDLEAVGQAVANARVVMISEAYHNSGEIMRLHHRVIRYLVENHGFNTVVAETSLPESRAIHDYVLGEAPVENLWWNGINTMYGEWDEGRALIEWLREHNRQNDGDAVHYYGIDIAGFYRDWRPPFKQVTDYLEQVDPDYANAVQAIVLPIIEIMADDARPRYLDILDSRQRAELTLALDRLVGQFDSKRAEYLEVTTQKEYEWARQSAISFQLADNYYHNYEQQTRGKSAKFAGLNGREVAMSRNIGWVMGQREDARVIVINHIIHTKTESMYQGETWGHFTPMGALVKQDLGKDLYSIGLAYSDGDFWDDWQNLEVRNRKTVAPPAPDGIEQTLGAVMNGDFFLDFRSAPRSAQTWLNEITTIREVDESLINVRPSEWDGIFFLDHATGATPVTER